MADSQLYSCLLFPKGHGYPLFRPQPPDDLPVEYRKNGASVGDIGVITDDGYFDFIFNICADADDPINQRGVPKGFYPLALQPGSIRSVLQHHGPGCDISSANVRKRRVDIDGSFQNNVFVPVGAGAVVEVTASSREVAMVLLPQGASRCNLRNLDLFRDYALANGLQWYSFVNGISGRRVENGGLYLVTGVDKATSWSVASVENHSSSGEISMKLTAALASTAAVSYRWQWEYENSASLASGPYINAGEEDWTNNQTVFLRGFKVNVRPPPVASVMGPIKISSMGAPKHGGFLGTRSHVPFSQTSSGQGGLLGGRRVNERNDTSDRPEPQFDVDIESIPTASEPYHPCSVLNNYLLLTVPEATVCVSHDDVWISVLREEDSELPNDEELLRRVLEEFSVTQRNGGAFIDRVGGSDGEDRTQSVKHKSYTGGLRDGTSSGDESREDLTKTREYRGYTPRSSIKPVPSTGGGCGFYGGGYGFSGFPLPDSDADFRGGESQTGTLVAFSGVSQPLRFLPRARSMSNVALYPNMYAQRAKESEAKLQHAFTKPTLNPNSPLPCPPTQPAAAPLMMRTQQKSK